jgi:predicted SnoaL-like aldol condensation-catalyzing enzyme
MKKILSLYTIAKLTTLAAALLATSLHAQEPVMGKADESLFTDADPLKNTNKQAALHIMKELLQCHQWDKAGTWLTDKYIQHNPNAQSGLEGVVFYFTQVAKQVPTPTCDKLTTDIVAVMAEGDLVTVVIPREYTNPNTGAKYYSTWFDMWRFVDGKADEHWDPATVAPAAPAAR